jgi:hypothetical protein
MTSKIQEIHESTGYIPVKSNVFLVVPRVNPWLVHLCDVGKYIRNLRKQNGEFGTCCGVLYPTDVEGRYRCDCCERKVIITKGMKMRIKLAMIQC